MSRNLSASFVLFLVAIPLSLGIAIASGVPPITGLIAAIVGGIVVGFFSGAPLMVSGPAAGLTVLVFGIMKDFGFSGVLVATLICGGVQILLGLARQGHWLTRIPEGVLQGMLSAIGLIILLAQLHLFLGQSVPESPLVGLLSLPDSLAARNPWSLCVGLTSLAILLKWPDAWGRFLPAPLVAVIFGVLMSVGWEVPRVGVLEIRELNLIWTLGNLGEVFQNPQVWLWGLGLGIIASAESLLTARAIPLLKNEPGHEPQLDRELKAQGMGNIFSGVLGGIPVTGVIVRTAANIHSGATSRLSTILHGAWVLLFVGLVPGVIEVIPLASLAAILIVTGVKLLNLNLLASLVKKRSWDALVWTGTLAAIVASDLIKGLAIGLILSMLIWAHKNRANWAVRSG